MPTTTETGPVPTRPRSQCQSWTKHKNSHTRRTRSRGLDTTETNDGTVTLDLADPHGDIVDTCTDPNSGSSGLGSYTENTEYGQPRDPTNVQATYGWLGSKKRSSNDLADLTLMGVRLYNPTTGRFLSIDPIPGGNANTYTYPETPATGFDLSGRCFVVCSVWHHITHIAHKVTSFLRVPLHDAMNSGLYSALMGAISGCAAAIWAAVIGCIPGAITGGVTGFFTGFVSGFLYGLAEKVHFRIRRREE